MENLCPCGSENKYENCCQPIHNELVIAQFPAELMRARYSAFVKKNIHFLVSSLDSQVRELDDEQSYSSWANTAFFRKLLILNESIEKNKGTVEFKAFFCEDNKEQVLHEISQFRKQNGKWYYRNGKVKIYENSDRAHTGTT